LTSKNKILIFVLFAILSVLTLSTLIKAIIIETDQKSQQITRTYQPQVQFSNSRKCFILLSSNNVESLIQVKNFIKNNGGRVVHVFPPNSLIANLTASLQNSLTLNYNAKVDCYFPVSIPSETKYGKNAATTAKVWNSGFKIEILPWTNGLSWGDTRLGRELLISEPTLTKRK
jgi:hypothetical protein